MYEKKGQQFSFFFAFNETTFTSLSIEHECECDHINVLPIMHKCGAYVENSCVALWLHSSIYNAICVHVHMWYTHKAICAPNWHWGEALVWKWHKNAKERNKKITKAAKWAVGFNVDFNGFYLVWGVFFFLSFCLCPLLFVAWKLKWEKQWNEMEFSSLYSRWGRNRYTQNIL